QNSPPPHESTSPPARSIASHKGSADRTRSSAAAASTSVRHTPPRRSRGACRLADQQASLGPRPNAMPALLHLSSYDADRGSLKLPGLASSSIAACRTESLILTAKPIADHNPEWERRELGQEDPDTAGCSIWAPGRR